MGKSVSDGVVAMTITVPNEESNAGTVKVELVLPRHAGAHRGDSGAVEWVDRRPSPRTRAGQVTSVTWTGGPLTGDEKVDFPLSVGNVPAGTKSIVFKGLQTYDNGDVVRWVEPTPAGGEEPEHPSPTLLVVGKAPAEEPATTSETPHHDG